MNVIVEPERKTLVVAKTDVVVVGGGPAGIAAAILAARNEAKTILVEWHGYLGGMATGGLVNGWPLLPHWPGREIIRGISKEMLDRLLRLGMAQTPAEAFETGKRYGLKTDHLSFDPEAMKWLANKMAEEAGVKLFLDTLAVDVVLDDNKVKGVLIENVSGRQAILADVVVDASGDGTIAARAGAPYEIAPREQIFPMTLMFAMGGVSWRKYQKYQKKDKGFKKLKEEAVTKEWLPPMEPVLPPRHKGKKGIPVSGSDYRKGYPLFFFPTIPLSYRPGECEVWGAHVRGNCSDAEDLSRAEVEARNKVFLIAKFLKKHLPGFEKSYLAMTAPQIGKRESRRIIGEYMLTADDLERGRRFSDVVGKGLDWIIGGWNCPPFDVPYRCLIPKKVDGLLVAGRCISVTKEAYDRDATRSQNNICMVTGEAAGVASAVSVKEGVEPKELDISLLQENLIKGGAIL